MKRALYKELKEWKSGSSRLPLILRGARQVGKSYLIEHFGNEEFDELYVLNFEKRSKWASCFRSMDPKEILREIELQIGRRIEPGRSLLFLDEIQDCPEALTALRYFAEEMPEQHVIAAGSLLEFIIEEEKFSFPVGRVDIMNLGPLSFLEYLEARDQPTLVEFLQTVQTGKEISEGVHQHLLEFVQEYLRVGGMPGIVSTFIETGSYLEARRRQASVLELYALDFGKYVKKSGEYHHLKILFEMIPSLVGKHFKYSKIDPECANPARDYKMALNRLRQARLILPVHFTKGNGLPLRSEKSEKKFKIFFLDIGLLAQGLGWERLELGGKKDSPLFRGVVSEQYVAQELLSMQDPYIERGLYYWENPQPSSSAEIDFLVNLNERIVPIEVKSGVTGRLKSLRQFMEMKSCSLGIRISEKPLSFEQGILSVPFYLVGEIRRFIKTYSSA